MPDGCCSSSGALWLFRAALAACDAILIAMRAAMLGVDLDHVEMIIDSESNDYGILGTDESVPAGRLTDPDAPVGLAYRVQSTGERVSGSPGVEALQEVLRAATRS